MVEITMINLILMEVQNTQSLEKAKKQIDDLEKQITDLQNTIISTQNNKISAMNGDISSIVGIFGLILAALSLISIIAVGAIQYFNIKAKQNIQEAKDLTQEAHELTKSANNINKNAIEELARIQKKISEVDFLMEFSQMQSLAHTKINTCKSILDIVSSYINIDSTTGFDGVRPDKIIEELKSEMYFTFSAYQARSEKISKKINEHYMSLNSIADYFYNSEKDQKNKRMKTVITQLSVEISNSEELCKLAEKLMSEAKDSYEQLVSEYGERLSKIRKKD